MEARAGTNSEHKDEKGSDPYNPVMKPLGQQSDRDAEIGREVNSINVDRDVIPPEVDPNFIRAEGVKRGLSQRRKLFARNPALYSLRSSAAAHLQLTNS